MMAKCKVRVSSVYYFSDSMKNLQIYLKLKVENLNVGFNVVTICNVKFGILKYHDMLTSAAKFAVHIK